MFLTSLRKTKIAVFPGNAVYEMRVLESLWRKERQPLSGFQILIAHKHLYSQNISVESSVLLEIDFFVCVCQKKKRTFQCDPSCNGLPKHMCLCVSCSNHLMRLEAIFLSAPKMSDAFLHGSDILKRQKSAFHMLLLSLEMK